MYKIPFTEMDPCCGETPYLDTWDKNEARSIHCGKCGKHTESHFCREFAIDEWIQLTEKKPHSDLPTSPREE